LGEDFPALVLAKVETFNPGNSVKDRMALKMIEDAEKDGRLKPGGTIIEGTSGNTGMGLALAAIIKGYKCIFVTNSKQSKEKCDILRAVGAEVIVCPTDVKPTDPRSYYSVSKRLAKETENGWYVNQYDNLSNRAAHYESTAPEIWEQTEGKLTHFVVGAGTGGTITGCGTSLKRKIRYQSNWSRYLWFYPKRNSRNREINLGNAYTYITEGIGEDILPENYDMSVIDHFEKVTDKDGAVYARKLAKEEGIFCGYSAGSAIASLVQMKDQFTKDDVIVVLFTTMVQDTLEKSTMMTG
jgi:cystathionine beta-synthase